MRYRMAVRSLLLLALSVLTAAQARADNPKVLLGSWSGKAAGPQGAPPTGDITVVFEKDGAELKGTFIVLAPSGRQFSGKIGKAELKSKVLTATAVFQLGETPLEVEVSGPLKGKTIAGTFTVSAKGQKMGDGTFSITKGAPRPPGPAK